MRGHAVACWWQKEGATEREYEDAYAIGADGDDDEWDLTSERIRLRVAVADGATESMLSGRWARALVGTYARSNRARLMTCLLQALEAWPQSLQEYKQRREESGKPIAWYEEPGLEHGAHATLLVAEFRSDANDTDGLRGTWTAEAIGDSCLFQVSDDELKAAFPLQASVQFNTSPALAHTGIRDRRLLDKHRTSLEGTWTSGDSFFLCTDALAAWFLAEHEAASVPWAIWREYHSAESRQNFRDWVAVERMSGRLKNDDVTLLNIQFD